MPRTKQATQREMEEAETSNQEDDGSTCEVSTQFLTTKHWDLFFNDFSKRKIVKGRNVNPDALSDFKIVQLFLDLGWDTLLDMGNEFSPMNIRKMSSFPCIFVFSLATCLLGMMVDPLQLGVMLEEIVLTESILVEILGIPHDREWVFRIILFLKVDIKRSSLLNFYIMLRHME